MVPWSHMVGELLRWGERERGEDQVKIHGRRWHMKTEAEIGGMWLSAKEGQGYQPCLEASWEAWTGFPRICRKNPHYQHPDFRLLPSRTVRQYLHFCGFKPPVCGPLLEQPWEIPGGSVVKNSPANAGDVGLIPGSGRSPGEGNGYLLQYSCLENPVDREAWWAAIRGVSQAMTERLNNSRGNEYPRPHSCWGATRLGLPPSSLSSCHLEEWEKCPAEGTKPLGGQGGAVTSACRWELLRGGKFWMGPHS